MKVVFHSAHTAKRRGQSLIETLIGIIVLVPIVLFLFDIATLVLSNSANDNLAKHCARAAASATNASQQGNGDAALNAANGVAGNFAESSIIKKTGGSFVTGFHWNSGMGSPAPKRSGNLTGGDAASGQVAVETTMQVNVPVPFPFFQRANFTARAVEPIVSIPPP